MNIDIFWRSQEFRAAEKKDIVSYKVFKQHLNSLMSEDQNLRIELDRLKKINQKLLARIDSLEEKWLKESTTLRELVNEKTIYIKDIEFKRISKSSNV